MVSKRPEQWFPMPGFPVSATAESRFPLHRTEGVIRAGIFKCGENTSKEEFEMRLSINELEHSVKNVAEFYRHTKIDYIDKMPNIR